MHLINVDKCKWYSGVQNSLNSLAVVNLWEKMFYLMIMEENYFDMILLWFTPVLSQCSSINFSHVSLDLTSASEKEAPGL